MRSPFIRVLMPLLCVGAVLLPMSSHADDAPTQPQYGEESAMFSQVDPRTGAMTYDYAFDLGSARGLVGPSLSLKYNSSMGDGSVAYGWSLAVPTIERRPLSGLPRSNAAGEPIGGDRYVFDGQPLVRICAIGGACPYEPFTGGHPAWADGWSYFRLQNEGLFARFYMSPSRTTFRAVFKGGDMVEFGLPLPEGGFETYGLDTDVVQWTEQWDNGITRWLPSIRRSLNHPNNVIAYRWAKLGSRGIAYLTDIWDTPPVAGATSPAGFEHHTQLAWSPLSNIAFSHAPPFRARPDFRLDRVGVASMPWSGAAPREVYRVYTLTYGEPRASRPAAGWPSGTDLAPLWQHTFLKQIVQTGHCSNNVEDANGGIPAAVQCASLPGVSFEYEAAVPTLFDSYVPTITNGPADLVTNNAVLPDPANAGIVDFDRDGRPDVVQSWPERCQGGTEGTIMRQSGANLVVYCLDHLYDDQDYVVRSARPMLGYRNEGPTVAAPAGKVFGYTCMDSGPWGTDSHSLSTAQAGPLQDRLPGFFASNGNTTLGAFGSGVAIWGQNGYLPIVARFLQNAPGGAEPAASGCKMDATFDPGSFHPAWRWQTMAVEPWQKRAPRDGWEHSVPEWNVDIDGDGFSDRLGRVGSASLGAYARAMAIFTRRYAKREEYPLPPPGPMTTGPALVPFAMSFESTPNSIVPVAPKDVWDPSPTAVNRRRVYYADINGDGFADAVSRDYLAPGAGIRVRPGDGKGSFRCFPSDPWPCTDEVLDGETISSYYELDIASSTKPWDVPAGIPAGTDMFFELADISGDGLADIVRTYKSGFRTRVEAWINVDGRRFECVGPPADPCLAGYFNVAITTGSPAARPRLTFGDMDSDGVNDMVFLSQKGAFVGKLNATPPQGANGARAVRPGQLIRIANGRGAKTEVKYETVQELAKAAADAGSPWAHRSPVVESVVTQIRTHNLSSGGSAKPAPFAIDRYVRFTYREPGYDNWARRFVGFRKVAVRSGFDQAVTETTYWLGPCENGDTPAENAPAFCPETSDDEEPASPSYRAWVGRPMRVDRYVPEVPGQSPRKYLWSKTFEYDPPAVLFGPSAAHPDIDRHVTFAYAKRVDTHLYAEEQPTSPGYSFSTLFGGDDIELAPAQAGHKIVSSTTRIDTNGSVVEQSNLGQEGSDRARATQRSDQPFGTPPEVSCDASWNCLPAYTSVFSHDAGGANPIVHRQQHFTYQGADLVKVEAWLDTTSFVTRYHPGGPGAYSATAPGAAAFGWKTQAELEYDPNGMLLLAKGPGDATTPHRSCARSSFDREFGHFPREVTAFRDACDAGPGLVTELSFDRDFGVPVTTTAPDLGVSMLALDPFGRVAAVFAPRADGLVGATDLVSDAIYGDFDPSPSVETRQYTGVSTYVRSVQVLGSLLEPAMSFQQADSGKWVVGGWTQRDAAGRAVITRRPFEGAAAALATAKAAGSVATPSLGAFEHIPDAFGRIGSVKENGAPIIARTWSPLATEVRDQEQLPGGAHVGAFTRVETNGLGEAVHVAQHGEGSVIDTWSVLDGMGQPTLITRTGPSAAPYARSMEWDSFGRIVVNSEPNTTDRATGRTIRYAFDDANRLAGTSDARGCGVDYYYDSLGRTIGEDYSPCLATQPEYTAYNPLAIPNGLEVENRYDAYDPTQVIPEAGFADDPGLAAGRLTSRVDRGAETHFNYDARGRGRRVSRRIAKPLSQQVAATDPYAAHWFRSRTNFDIADRVTTRTTGADGPEMIAGGVNTETYAYSSRGLLRSISAGSRSIIQNITYRAADGLVENIFYGDLANTKVAHSYDGRNRLSTYKVSRTAPTLWGLSSSASYTKPDATTTQTTLVDLRFTGYDLVGNPTRIEDLTPVPGFDEDSYPVRNRDVVYDDFYRVRRVGYGYGVVDGVATYRPAFKAEIESGDTRPAARRNLPTRPREQQFEYDFMGNTLATSDDLVASYDRSLGNVVNGDGTGWGPNQLTASDGASARYDESGNLVELKVSRPGNCPSGMGSRCAQWYAYEWDEVGQLSRARRWDYASTLPAPAGEVPDETPTWDLRYAYSGGLRVLKSATDSSSVERHTLEVFGSLRFEHDQYLPALDDYERSRIVTHVYLAGGVGHAFYDDSLPAPPGASHTRLYLNVGDHLGSTTAVIDHTTSELVERSTFMAYGALESDYRPARWSHAREPYKFTGKEEDIEVGATYFGARYYNAHLGRFMSADPLTIHGLASDMNPYAYVRGRVMNRVDPNGLQDKSVADDAASASAPVGGYENFAPPPNSIPASDNWTAAHGYTPFLWFLGQVVNGGGSLPLDGGLGNPLNPWGAPGGTSFWVPTPAMVTTVYPDEQGSAGGVSSHSKNLHSLPRADPYANYPNATRDRDADEGRIKLAELAFLFVTEGLSELLATKELAGDGLVEFAAPAGATPDQIAQMRAYVRGSNEALEAGALSPTGRVSTKGALRQDASNAARAERARAQAAGTPYRGHAGHVPDTTWSGQPEPFAWLDLDASINSSLGGQANGYRIGFKPTGFVLKP